MNDVRFGSKAEFVVPSAPKRGMSNPVCCKPFVMERSEGDFLFRAYVFANASAELKAIIGGRFGKNLAMGSV